MSHNPPLNGKNKKAKNPTENPKNKKERIPNTTSRNLSLSTKNSVLKPEPHLKNSVLKKIILEIKLNETIYEINDRGITYQGPFKKYLPNGYGMCCFEKGEVYVGDFVNGEAETSEGYYIFYDGSYYEG